MKVAGRKEEIKKLSSLLDKDQPEFVAVYGRRRIGKTYLVRQVFAEKIVFECAGLHQKDISQQLENFWLTLNEFQKPTLPTPPPKTWLQAFAQLKSYLGGLLGKEKKVVFLDEVPWFETQHSGFLAALDNFWNQFCSRRPDIILVICGSAASWIIQKVVNDRGGLHNRITAHIQLMPFRLAEAKEFLEMQNVQLSPKDTVELYMCVGGIPFYLKDAAPGRSLPQILDDLLLGKQAVLHNEFPNLYASLFKNSQAHETVVQALASKNKGLTRSEIIGATGMNSGGGLSVVLEELLQCGFVQPIFPLKKAKEDCLYRLVDEFTLFYFRFLHPKKTGNSWMQICRQPAYKAWAGYTFENTCFKYVLQIKKALGIQGIISNEYSWVKKGTATEAGAQIDLIIDRSDNCINLLELKFQDAVFEMDKACAEQLRERGNLFRQQTKTRKNIFLTLLAASGAKRNAHFLSVVQQELGIEDLFL